VASPEIDIEVGRHLLLDTLAVLIKQRGAIDVSMTDLAAKAGMSPANINRYFESKEAILAAFAEEWFADKVKLMEEVAASDMPAREKMLAFFARRFALLQARFNDDPELFQIYCELGSQHFEVVRGYVDLGDHYLAMIVAEAMAEGYFEGLSIDQAVSLINQMVQPYCNVEMQTTIGHLLSEVKLAMIIDTIFSGMRVSPAGAPKTLKASMQLVI
jgi:TetR/AcrR family transcriptional repressor of the ameABC operon